MHELEDKIFSFVRLNGPVLPVQISKSIDKDIMYSGAILSSLVASGKVKITNVKMGGSPFYYVAGQEGRLQELSKFLREREKEAYEILKQKKVVRDSELGPVHRVAIRDVKDFAFPITVKNDEKEETFWKWYLLNDSDAKNLISNYFPTEEKHVEVKEEIQQTQIPLAEVNKEARKELFKRIEQAVKREEPSEKAEKPEKSFEYLINDYAKKNGIKILNYNIVRKNKEIEMVIKLPTQIGELTFFVKAKNKKSISNADLSLACNEGQQKNLPTLFITTGKATKKSAEFIEKNLKNQLILKQI